MNRVRHFARIAVLFLAGGPLHAQAVPSNTGPSAATKPRALQHVGFEPPLNGPTPLDLAFRDETRRCVERRYYFGQHNPRVLAFAHSAGVMLLTPDGLISRYFYGIEYPGRDMRLGLVDASAGKSGTPIDHALLFCYPYGPTAATYCASILKIIRLGGVLTILCIIGGILLSRRRETLAAARNLRRPLPSGMERGAH